MEHQGQQLYSIHIYGTLPDRLEQGVRALNGICFPHNPVTAKTDVEKYGRQDRFGRVIALDGDARPIGKISLMRRVIPYAGERIVLGGIAGVGTDPAWRNRGVATAMLRAAMPELHQAGCDVAFLCTDVENPARIRLYGSVGFVRMPYPYTYTGASGKTYVSGDGMLAPVRSHSLFSAIITDPGPFDIGHMNW